MPIQIEFTGFEQVIKVNQQNFYPQIFEGEGDVPASFNSVCVRLDVSERSLLRWERSIQRAEELKKKGFWIVWELQFDLFAGALEDDSRWMTFQLGIQYFLDKIWPIFHSETLGIILYRGAYPFKAEDYLKFLGSLLPDEVPIFLYLDLSQIVDPAVYFCLTSLEKWGFLRLVLKGPCAERYPYALPNLAWDHGNSALGYSGQRPYTMVQSKRIEHAFCLHGKVEEKLLNEAISMYERVPFRIIPEALLTQEWDGIEELIIFPDFLEERGWRKIRGFQAAGGKIINYPNGEALLPLQEISQPVFQAFSKRIS